MERLFFPQLYVEFIWNDQDASKNHKRYKWIQFTTRKENQNLNVKVRCLAIFYHFIKSYTFDKKKVAKLKIYRK